MGEQLALDLKKGLQLKEQGMELAAMSNQQLLQRAREVAHDLLLRKEAITVDDVRLGMGLQAGKQNRQNWMGAIFRASDFAWTGQYRKSASPHNHAAEVKVWRLADD